MEVGSVLTWEEPYFLQPAAPSVARSASRLPKLLPFLPTSRARIWHLDCIPAAANAISHACSARASHGAPAQRLLLEARWPAGLCSARCDGDYLFDSVGAGTSAEPHRLRDLQTALPSRDDIAGRFALRNGPKPLLLHSASRRPEALPGSVAPVSSARWNRRSDPVAPLQRAAVARLFQPVHPGLPAAGRAIRDLYDSQLSA